MAHVRMKLDLYGVTRILNVRIWHDMEIPSTLNTPQRFEIFTGCVYLIDGT